MKQILSLLIAVFTPIWVGLAAQVDMAPLPEQPPKLYEEISTILSYQNQQESLEILELFKKNVKERRVTDQHNAGLVKLGNEMIARKMKRYSFFKYIIATINGFAADDEKTNKYFDTWVDISIRLLADQPEGKTAAYENYLKFATYFWIEGNVYQSSFNGGGHSWKAISKDFVMKYNNQELAIRYENTDLYGFNKSDSVIIENVRGTYYPLAENFNIERARANWNQDGAMDAYADLKNFNISTRNTEVKCENAVLTYPSVFKKQIEGKFNDRITKRKTTGMSYPQFESKSRDIQLEDIGEGVNYVGGFFLKGALVRGYGDAEGKSTIYINDRTNKRIIKAIASDFDITKGEKVISDDAEVSVYMTTQKGLDSIYHPNIRITYNIKTREVELTRGANQASRVPFTNSYLQGEMNTAIIRWKIDSTNMRIGNDAEDVSFDSEAFFNPILYERYQPHTGYNYINLFSSYSDKLAQYKQETLDKKCTTSQQNAQTNVDNSFCQFYPEECTNDPETGKLVPKARLEEPQVDPNASKNDVNDINNLNPLDIHGNVLARLLDKRIEGKTFMTPCEIQKKREEFQEKLGPNYTKTPNYKNFIKTVVDVTLVELITTKPAPSHDISNTLRLYLDMVADGFVVYNAADTIVSLRPKMSHYHKSTNTKNKDNHDYDNMRIKSIRGDQQKSPQNATMDMTTGNIDVGKVQKFILSESKNVYAQLDAGGNSVTLKEGRDMDFAGDVYAGFFQFAGRGFHFNYRDFLIDMDSIDAIFIRVYKRFRFDEIYDESEIKPEEKYRFTNLRYYDLEDDGTKKYSQEKIMLNNHIANTSGQLKIDVSNNKSGRGKSRSDLPDFDCGGKPGGFVYYNGRQNLQGENVYPKETFYYELKPFVKDSLNDFLPEKWKLDGRFVSADILPEVKEPLRIMFHDLSLGFEMSTPKKGFNIYLRDDKDKGKGDFTGVFGVSNEGLLGKGNINYLGAQIESDYIVFLPERFRAENVDSFNLEKSTKDGVEFPKVAGTDVEIDWAPYSDSMYISSNVTDGIPFKMFDSGEYTLDGGLILTPEGLLGRGTFDWEEGTLTSNPGGDFVFGSNSVKSASTAAIIKSTGLQQFAFQNDNVEANVDFTARIGDFISNEKDLSTDLPYNNYKTSLDRFHWEMDNKKILIESTQGKAGFFLSTEQTQDSLFFLGEKADYDLNTGLLRIDGVDYIRVADAFIYPKDRHVEIEERAHMRTLTDSKVVADTSNQNHVIQRAVINILSRREYNADGYLEFNVEGHKNQEIKFDNVRVEQDPANPSSFVTKGSGSVADSANFYLDKKTRFRGDVALSADSKDLIFKGYSKLTSSALARQEWFAIDSRIDKKDVAISYNEPQNPEGVTLYTGIYLSQDSGSLYPAIMAPKGSMSDRSVFSATGVLHYDVKEDAYMFGDSAKVMGDSAVVGKKMVVYEKNSKVTAEGKFDFQQGFIKQGYPFIGVSTVGDFSFFLNKKSEYRFDMAMNIEFPLPKSVIDFVNSELNSAPDVIDPILYASVSNAKLPRNLLEILNQPKNFDKIWARAEADNRLNLPDDYAHTFFLSKVTMVWSEKTQSFISDGMIQLASFSGKHVGQNIQGGLEIIPNDANGDILNFYFNAPNGEWLFFTYNKGVLRACASKSDLTTIITTLKKKDKKLKTSNGEMLEIDISNAGEYGAVKNRISNGR